MSLEHVEGTDEDEVWERVYIRGNSFADGNLSAVPDTP